jgi:hypothetical protein
MFKETDFEGLFINPFKIPATDKVLQELALMPEHYKMFATEKEFKADTGKVPLWKILRYIGFVYTKNSPFEQEENYLKLKVEAGHLAEFETNDTETDFLPEYKRILTLESHVTYETVGTKEIAVVVPNEVSRMVLAYCFMQHDSKFIALKQNMDNYYLELDAYKTESDATKRSSIIKNYTEIARTIEKLKSEYLNGDNKQQLTEELFLSMSDDKLPTPEIVAQSIADGEPVVNINPYGKGYKPEKLVYIPD